MASKPKQQKSWREKLANDNGCPKVEIISEKLSRKWGTGTVVIPAPREVDEIMKTVPEGQLITINEIRAMLAQKHGATIACPITTGIFAWIAANAAMEAAAEGKEDITPYWRTLKSGGVVNEKYPGGVEFQKTLLEKEGHRVAQKGKNCVVADLKDCLVKHTSLAGECAKLNPAFEKAMAENI